MGGHQGKPGRVGGRPETRAELRFEFVMFVQDGGLECGHTVAHSGRMALFNCNDQLAMPGITASGIRSKQGAVLHCIFNTYYD